MFGILNVNKPKGKTSHDIVSFVRRTLHMKRVGHTGTLDPDATGVLPILVGKATKLSDLLMAEEKRYVARVQLGIVTDTDDTTGKVLQTKAVSVTIEQINEAVARFLGETEQIPPMYSAIKVDGQKLYSLARKGVVTERKPRSIQIYSATASDFDGTSFRLDVHCSKGTYIRALCRDIGEVLGTGAAMADLIRTQSGSFFITESYTLEEIEKAAQENRLEELLISADEVLSHIDKIEVEEENKRKITNGIRLRPEQLGIAEVQEHQLFRVYFKDKLLCVLKVMKEENQFLMAIDKSFY